MTQEMAAPTESYGRAVVRIYKSNKVIGAGFLVTGGYVLTCAHVVHSALGKDRARQPLGEVIEIKFPFIKRSKKLKAKVLACHLKEEGLDVAGLILQEPLPATAIALALQPQYPWGEKFSVYGFPDGAMGVWASGQFKGECPREDDSPSWIQIEGETTQGYGIKPGFSGSAVWNHSAAAVVGMTVARDKSEPESKVAFMIPAKPLLAIQQKLESLRLLDLLGKVSEPLQLAIAQAFQLCCPSGWSKPTPANLAETLEQLQQMPRGDSSYEAIDRFAALLVTPELNPDDQIRAQFEQWLEARVADRQGLMNEVKSRVPQSDADEKPPQAHLLIYVEDGASESRNVVALFIPNASEYESRSAKGCDRLKAPGLPEFGEKVTVGTLPALLRACLAEVTPRSKNIVVELILPFAWLHQDCDRWAETDSSELMLLLGLDVPQLSIGSDRAVVLRISERLNAAIPALYRQKWESKWEALQQLKPHETCDAFVPGDGLSIRQQLPGELNKACHVGLKLSTCCDESEHSLLFGTLIATGTPAALWLRQDQFNQTVVAADEMNALLNCKIATLPEAVKRCRSDAMGQDEDAHIGHHLAFLWEDPNLVPPSTDNRNAMSLGMPQPS